MGKILAIDFGLKRTGLSISDEMKMFAFGLETVDSSSLMQVTKKLVEKEKIDTIVIGLPKHLDGSDTNITQNVYLLKDALKKEFPKLEIELFDERFTSKMASQSIHLMGATKKQKRDKKLVDKISATIILQSFIERET